MPATEVFARIGRAASGNRSAQPSADIVHRGDADDTVGWATAEETDEILCCRVSPLRGLSRLGRYAADQVPVDAVAVEVAGIGPGRRPNNRSGSAPPRNSPLPRRRYLIVPGDQRAAGSVGDLNIGNLAR